MKLSEKITQRNFENELLNKDPAAYILYKKLQNLKKRAATLSNKIFNSIDLLENTCQHVITHIEEKNIEGTYYDLAEYHKIKKCAVCGKELDRTTTKGGYG